MIIDAHAHITPKLNAKFSNTPNEKILEILLKEMRDNGVDQTFVIASYRDDVCSPRTQETLELVKNTPQIRVIGTLNIETFKKKDLDALEKLLKARAIIGIKLYLGYQYIYAYDQRVFPIYELCTMYDVPAVFHTGDTFRTDGKLRYSHPLTIDDVAVEFPNLKIVIAHVGNPWVLDCAAVLYKNENVYADISGLVVCNNFDTPDGELVKRRIKELIAYASPNKLIYGTDWPLANMGDYIKFTESLGITGRKMECMMGENALAVFSSCIK